MLELSFPDEAQRGIGWSLEYVDGDAIIWTHLLVSAPDGEGEPQVQPADPEAGVEAVGIDGPGPDIVEVPADAVAGPYRLCGFASQEPFCGEPEITDE